MQSSGVGNCINMLSLPVICRFPLLTLVTMRGEWAEFNPWQVPMGRATQPCSRPSACMSARRDAGGSGRDRGAGCTLAFDSDRQVAVLIGQRLIGAKKW